MGLFCLYLLEALKGVIAIHAEAVGLFRGGKKGLNMRLGINFVISFSIKVEYF